MLQYCPAISCVMTIMNSTPNIIQITLIVEGTHQLK